MSEQHADWRVRRPSPRLAGLVDRYVGYRMVGFPAGVHRGVPSPYMTLIVSIGDPIDVVAHTDPSQAPASYRTVVGGLQATSALIAHEGRQEGIAVELTPLGSRFVLGPPARALWDRSLDLEEVLGADARELSDRLQCHQDWDSRFAVLNEVLERRIGDGAAEPALERAWRLLTETAGTLSVEDVARRVGWTRQHLARRFDDEFGATPKLVARIARFDRARTLLVGAGAAASVAGVAAACGYFDQAHMAREFVAFAGVSPSRLLHEEVLPFVQDDTPVS